jgi:hypothetical protein
MAEQAAVEREELRHQIDQHERTVRLKAEVAPLIFAKPSAIG